MKKRNLLLLLVALTLTGCARSYVMKLSNGRQITTASKPKAKGANYYFKDAKGEVQSIPQSRVQEIMPASMAKKEKGPFNPSAR